MKTFNRILDNAFDAIEALFVGAILIGLAFVGARAVVAADIGSMKDTDNRDRPFLVAPAKSAPGITNSWTSVWAAALASYNMSNSVLNFDRNYDFDRETPLAWNNAARLDGFGGEGFSGDVQIGGDVQFGRIVAGVFGEYSFGGIESSASVSPIFMDSASLSVEQQDSYSILARLGVTSSDSNTLLYVASGYTWTTVEATLRVGEGSAKEEFEFGGIPLELGVEHKFGPNVRGRLAGRYTWFGEETVAERSFGQSELSERLTAEPGIFSIKAGVVISTSGGSLNPLN